MTAILEWYKPEMTANLEWVGQTDDLYAMFENDVTPTIAVIIGPPGTNGDEFDIGLLPTAP